MCSQKGLQRNEYDLLFGFDKMDGSKVFMIFFSFVLNRMDGSKAVGKVFLFS